MFILLKFIETFFVNMTNSRKFTLVMKNAHFFKLAYSLNFLNFFRIYFMWFMWLIFFTKKIRISFK